MTCCYWLQTRRRWARSVSASWKSCFLCHV